MSIFNLSLDDFSPHVHAGLYFNEIETCNKLIEEFPNIKINLFVPAAYCRLHEQPRNITRFMKWVEQVKQLPENYRINLHGYNHRRESKKYGMSNNDEWQHLSKKEALQLGKQMLNEFEAAELPYTPTFRPPGWKISKEAVQALQELGITCIAGDDRYQELVKDVLKIKWVNYNWDMVEECNIQTGDVIAYGHTSSWTNNYMNEERSGLILKLLRERELSFKFIEEC